MSRPLPINNMETKRLVLDQPRATDADIIVRYVGDIDVSSKLAKVPHPYASSDAGFFLTQIVPTASVWALRRKDAPGLIGVIGLSPHESDADAELGYWLGKPFWGHGYATEATRAVMAHAAQSGLRRVFAGYFDVNPASGHVLEKVGFRATGRSEDYCAATRTTNPLVTMIWQATG